MVTHRRLVKCRIIRDLTECAREDRKSLEESEWLWKIRFEFRTLELQLPLDVSSSRHYDVTLLLTEFPIGQPGGRDQLWWYDSCYSIPIFLIEQWTTHQLRRRRWACVRGRCSFKRRWRISLQSVVLARRQLPQRVSLWYKDINIFNKFRHWVHFQQKSNIIDIIRGVGEEGQLGGREQTPEELV